MSISSNSFFHFTSGREVALLGILQNGFRISVSHEVIYNTGSQSVFGIPMVCFCDIPLSVSHEHARNFCQDNVFGLGMNRNWGTRVLHPVQYYPRQQDVFFQEHSNYLTNRFLSKDSYDSFKPDSVELAVYNQMDLSSYKIDYTNILAGPGTLRLNELFGLIKPVDSVYYGFNTDKKEVYIKNKDYIFYNEREWRYVTPNRKDLKIPYFCQPHKPDVSQEKNSPDIYVEDWQKSREYFNKLENYLPFSSTDLTWIIVDTEEAAKCLVRTIRSSDFKKIGGKPIVDDFEKDQLIQKVISHERIMGDVYVH